MFFIKKYESSLVVLAIFSLTLSLPNLASAASDYSALNDLSTDKCLNILVDTGNVQGVQEFYYNGEVVDIPNDYISISQAQIAGDRMGYIAWKSPLNGGKGEVLVDGKSFGSVIDWAQYNPQSIDFQMVSNADFKLKINQEHVVYLRMVGLSEISAAKAAAGYKGTPIFHVIFDNQDFGEIATGDTDFRLNGNYVIFKKLIKGQYHIFANDKDLGVGYHGDYDGKNIALVKENYNLYFNGKKVTNIGAWGNLELKKGMLSYDKGLIYSPSVVFKGKNIGKGYRPRIEGKNVAFLRSAQTSQSFVYNNKVFKNIYTSGAFGAHSFSLTGDHFAFMQKSKNIVGVNVDGKFYDGAVGDSVQISQQDDCQE